MTPEERFLAEELELDDEGRRGWGLRDQVTGDLATAGGEIDRYGTRDQAEWHRRTHWSQVRRREAVDDHIEQHAADAAHRQGGRLLPPRDEPVPFGLTHQPGWWTSAAFRETSPSHREGAPVSDPDDLWEPDPLLDLAAALGNAATAASDPSRPAEERQAALDSMHGVPATDPTKRP